MARSLGLTFDTGALIALERRRQRMADVFRRATQRGVPITVPASVVAEWWRGQRSQLARDILAAVDVEPVTEPIARAAGEALAATRRRNSVDAVVVASAAMRGDIVYTSDVADLTRLAAHFRSVRILGA
jgi:predicted nucleic acid-binding protein